MRANSVVAWVTCPNPPSLRLLTDATASMLPAICSVAVDCSSIAAAICCTMPVIVKPTGKRVLFADDSLVARKQIIKTLERLGLSYLQSTTGREAWEQLVAVAEKAASEGKKAQDEIQLILTDVEMPEMDGFTLTKRVTSDPRFAGIPVIMHSSLTGVCNADKGKTMGATDYVGKFDPKILTEVIQRYCGLKESQT